MSLVNFKMSFRHFPPYCFHLCDVRHMENRPSVHVVLCNSTMQPSAVITRAERQRRHSITAGGKKVVLTRFEWNLPPHATHWLDTRWNGATAILVWPKFLWRNPVLTTCFFIWRHYLMILMRENPSLRPLEGVGPENHEFFGPKLHSLHFVAISGPKKSRFSGPTPSNGPRNGFSRIKIITSRAI
jgi:hypothetical protein